MTTVAHEEVWGLIDTVVVAADAQFGSRATPARVLDGSGLVVVTG
jgi:hypothetical protein